MATFSERNGYTKVPDRMVPESITPELRNLLWNVIVQMLKRNELSVLTYWLWHDLYKLPTDSRPTFYRVEGVSYSETWDVVRDKYFSASWSGVYDHIEFFAKRWGNDRSFNMILEQEGAAYRIIDGQVCQITNQLELDAVANAISNSGVYSVVGAHVQTALSLFSNRENPDYRNSIKESISAVEAMAKIAVSDDKATLGQVLGKLEAEGKINAALKKGFGAIYGWTSDANGIRHALTEMPAVRRADAQFFLIACSAFANYIKTQTQVEVLS